MSLIILFVVLVDNSLKKMEYWIFFCKAVNTEGDLAPAHSVAMSSNLAKDSQCSLSGVCNLRRVFWGTRNIRVVRLLGLLRMLGAFGFFRQTTRDDRFHCCFWDLPCSLHIYYTYSWVKGYYFQASCDICVRVRRGGYSDSAFINLNMRSHRFAIKFLLPCFAAELVVFPDTFDFYLTIATTCC